MIKITKKVVAFFIFIGILFVFSGCSDEFNEKWEAYWEKDSTTTTETKPSESMTPIPISTIETVEYFNSLVKNIKSVRPAFNYEFKYNLVDVESHELIEASVKSIKSYMLKTKKDKIEFGSPVKDFYQFSGDVNSPAISPDDVTSAKCTQEENEYTIKISIRDEEQANSTEIISKYFEIESKSEVLAEFQKAKGYFILSDYDQQYKGSEIECVVDRLTDRVIRINYIKSSQIETQITGAGELVNIGDANLKFTFINEIVYSNFGYEKPEED